MKIRIWRTGEIFPSRRSILQINNLAFYASVIRLTIIAVNLNVGVYSIESFAENDNGFTIYALAGPMLLLGSL